MVDFLRPRTDKYKSQQLERYHTIHRSLAYPSRAHPVAASMSTPVTQIPRFSDVPTFAGQGTAAGNSAQTRQQALRDAETASGLLLLSSCYQAFLIEISSLSLTELKQTEIDLSDFATAQSLLAVPAEKYQRNPIISGTTLFLVQALRYLAHIESSGIANNSITPFSDALRGNIANKLGVLGFSSGILAACVVGTSMTSISYISNAVEAYRLAFWIGVRSQQYRTATLSVEGAPGKDSMLPWSLVFLRMNRATVEQAIEEYTQKEASRSVTPLYLTAVVDDACVTVSGRPDVLAGFAASLPTASSTHKTSVDTLYHSPIHISGARAAVHTDVILREIRFPNFADIKAPIRSSWTGQLIDKDGAATSGFQSLTDAVVEMILTQPVNWDKVIQGLVEAAPAEGNIRFLNFGPGKGLTRSMERAFPSEYATSVDLTKGTKKAPQPESSTQDSIAIVGMAVNMPGAPSTTKLWEVLEKGINTIAEIPEHRFKVSDYNHPKDEKTNRQMKAHTGNFIDNAEDFDNKFFKISPREAKSMDPQQRILLTVAYEALENSGYVPNATPTFQQDTFGCYVGVATHDYVQNLRDDIDVYYSTGTLRAFLSGRISYAMQLSGPSIVTDTACSSSMVAVYQACRALINGDCNAALAGGVNVITSPDMYLGLDRGHFLSPTGQCKAFDASADGYSRSEGCGLFVLKRLSDAIAENDNIMGIIRGIDVNQSGLAHSITHPHAPTQAKLFTRVLNKCGVDPTRINVVEAHGTGTQAGDPNELESIRSIFAVQRQQENPLHITSIKANIGHLEAASGAAGLAKLLLMLKHRTIPAQVSLKNLNPKIAPLESDNTVIDRVQTKWVPSQEGLSRMAMLNNFGAAGSNGTLILEEFLPSAAKTPESLAQTLVFGLSAKTESALMELRARYIQWLQDPANNDVPLSDAAYTATARRIIYPYRLAVSSNNKKDLISKLENATPVQVGSEAQTKVVFVFSGQGGQYLGMGSTLYRTCALFRQHVDECHSILTTAGFPGVTSIIDAKAGDSGLSELEELEAYQASIFVLEYALAQLWISWGIFPSAVVGHSLGEYAALVVAGVLSLKGALSIIANRVRFMIQKCAIKSTGLIAVNLGSSAVSEILASSNSFDDLSIACYNSDGDCVVAGAIEQLQALKAHLDSTVRCKSLVLPVPYGYHSSAMGPLLEDLTTVAKHVTLHPPSIPIISNVVGQVVRPGDNSVFTPEYFARHCAEPVQFEKGIRCLCSDPEFSQVDAWIEIGPHPTSLPMLKSISSVSKGGLLLGSMKKNQDAWITLSDTLSKLYVSQVPVNWRPVFAHIASISCAELPSYPFSVSKFWVGFKDRGSAVSSAETQIESAPTNLVSDYSMLHAWKQTPSTSNGNIAIFETPISLFAKSIQGHSVGGMPLCPASVYLEQVLAGVELGWKHLDISFADSHTVLRDIEFAKPLVYSQGVARIVATTLTLATDGSGSFQVSSRVGSESESVHVHGTFRTVANSKSLTKFSRVAPVIRRQMLSVNSPSKDGAFPETFSTRTAYEVIFPRVVDYAKEYHTMQSLTVDPTGMEGYAVVKLPADHDRGKFVVHPVFMDTLLHVAGFVANMQGGVNDAYICAQVGNVKVIPDLVDNHATYGVFCSNAWLPEEGVMLADAYAVELTGAKRIIAHLKGMHFRKVRLNSLKRGLQMAAGQTPAPVIASRIQPPRRTSSARTVSFSDSGSQGSARGPDVQETVVRIVAETCAISLSSLDIKADLTALGVDSLMSIEIFSKLQCTFPTAELNPQVLSCCHTPADIVAVVASKCGGECRSSSPKTLIAESTVGPDVQETIVHIVAETCAISISSLDINADLTTLGVDSLMSIEIFSKLQSTFPTAELNAQVLSCCHTPADIVAVVSSKCGGESRDSSPRTLVADDQGSATAAIVGDEDPDVKPILASVLGVNIEEIGDDVDFDSLGLDSLTSIEALHALRSAFAIDLPASFFHNCPTTRSVQAYLTVKLRAKVKETQVSVAAKVVEATQSNLNGLVNALRLDTIPLPLQTSASNSRSPLFLIHDGSGLVNYYERLSSLNRNVWGIHNPNFISGESFEGVEAMASQYVDYITKTQSGPLLLGGWSFGGVVAFEAARILLKRGVQVKGVVLIDSPSPVNHVPLSDSLIDSVVKLDSKTANSDIAKLIKAQFQTNSRLLGKYDPLASKGPFPPLVLLRSQEGYNPSGVSVQVPQWLADRSEPRQAAAGWEKLVGSRVKIMDIPGHHFQPFQASNISQVSAKIGEGCEFLERL
ncbi:hypothetical protein JAAARDRAFT_583047 [Jaapia argillacea MUCL 33604]|uniref:Polyketide synthase n=1 Tax=Jaapia argillacea MUCL 33604 TaxID=933084 RepID=A0A067PHQ1_9AGAM|nr:hypothetical protein JAAARDRAFT_583047 [Jaapia argillacea MUCL 33604]